MLVQVKFDLGFKLENHTILEALINVYFCYELKYLFILLFFQVSKFKVRKVKVAPTSCSCKDEFFVLFFSCKDDMHDFFVQFFSFVFICLEGKTARLWGCRIENNVAADWIFSVKLGLCFCGRATDSICRDLSLGCFVS